MKELRKYAKYVIWVVLFYFFTNFLIFVGFNASYKKIELRESLPGQIVVDKAETSKSQVRIRGKVKNSTSNNLNNKFLKISIFDINSSNISTEYIKIDNLKEDEEKPFEMTTLIKNAKSYEINIVDNN